MLQKIWKFIGDNSEQIKLISGIFVAAFVLTERLMPLFPAARLVVVQRVDIG